MPLFVAAFFALTPLPSAAQPKTGGPPASEALDQAVLRYILPFTTDLEATDWKARWALVNDDDALDALVYVSGPDWCGSGGCTLLVFEAISGDDVEELGAFRPAAEVSLVHGPVLLGDGGPEGWRDLFVTDVAGAHRVLRFDGETYPGSPDAGAPVAASPGAELVFAGAQ